MSLEQELRYLTQAVTELKLAIRAITPAASTPWPKDDEADSTETPESVKEEKPKAVKAAKASNKELLAEVKLKAAEVMEKCGRDKLTWLLGCFGVSKLSELKPGDNVYPDFLGRANELIGKQEAPVEGGETKVPAEEDLLDDAPADTAKDTKPVTMEEVKSSLKKVMEHPELGRNFVSGILSALGVERLGELTANKFNDAIEKAEAELKKVAA